jgi:hypothetical protein
MLIQAPAGDTVLVIVDGQVRCAGAVLAFELQPGQRPAALTIGGTRFDADTAHGWAVQHDDGSCDDPSGRHRTVMDFFKAVTGRAMSFGPLEIGAGPSLSKS